MGTWVGKQIAFSSYSYADMQGNGNSNVHQVVDHNELIGSWYFVYFAYSKKEKSAVGVVYFSKNKQRSEVLLQDVNHYVSKQLLVWIGKDKFYDGFHGLISNVKMYLCKDAYNPKIKPGKDYT